MIDARREVDPNCEIKNHSGNIDSGFDVSEHMQLRPRAIRQTKSMVKLVIETSGTLTELVFQLGLPSATFLQGLLTPVESSLANHPSSIASSASADFHHGIGPSPCSAIEHYPAN